MLQVQQVMCFLAISHSCAVDGKETLIDGGHLLGRSLGLTIHACDENRSVSRAAVGRPAKVVAPRSVSAAASSEEQSDAHLEKQTEISVASDVQSEERRCAPNLDAGRLQSNLSAKHASPDDAAMLAATPQQAISEEKHGASDRGCPSCPLPTSRGVGEQPTPATNLTSASVGPGDDGGVGEIARQCTVYPGLQLALTRSLSFEDVCDEEITGFAFQAFSSPSLHTSSDKMDSGLWNQLGCPSTPCSSNGSKTDEGPISVGASEVRPSFLFGASQATKFFSAGALSLEETDCGVLPDTGTLSWEGDEEADGTDTHFRAVRTGVCRRLSRDEARTADFCRDGDIFGDGNHFAFLSPSGHIRKHTFSPTAASATRQAGAFSLSPYLLHPVAPVPVQEGASGWEKGTSFFGVVCSCLPFCDSHCVSRWAVVDPLSCPPSVQASPAPCVTRWSREAQPHGGDQTVAMPETVQKSCCPLENLGETPVFDVLGQRSPSCHRDELQLCQLRCPRLSSSYPSCPLEHGEPSIVASSTHEQKTRLELPSTPVCMDNVHLSRCTLLPLADSSTRFRSSKTLNDTSSGTPPCSAPVGASKASGLLPGDRCGAASPSGDSTWAGSQSTPSTEATGIFSTEGQEKGKPRDTAALLPQPARPSLHPNDAGDRPAFELGGGAWIRDSDGHKGHGGTAWREDVFPTAADLTSSGAGMLQSRGGTAPPGGRSHPAASYRVEEGEEPQVLSGNATERGAPAPHCWKAGSPTERRVSAEYTRGESRKSDEPEYPKGDTREIGLSCLHASPRCLTEFALRAAKQEGIGNEYCPSSVDGTTPQDVTRIKKRAEGEADQGATKSLALRGCQGELLLEAPRRTATESVAGLFCVDGALESPSLQPLPSTCLTQSTLPAAASSAQADGSPFVPLPFLVYRVNAPLRRDETPVASDCTGASGVKADVSGHSTWRRETPWHSASPPSFHSAPSLFGSLSVSCQAVSPTASTRRWRCLGGLEPEACSVPAAYALALEGIPLPVCIVLGRTKLGALDKSLKGLTRDLENHVLPAGLHAASRRSCDEGSEASVHRHLTSTDSSIGAAAQPLSRGKQPPSSFLHSELTAKPATAPRPGIASTAVSEKAGRCSVSSDAQATGQGGLGFLSSSEADLQSPCPPEDLTGFQPLAALASSCHDAAPEATEKQTGDRFGGKMLAESSGHPGGATKASSARPDGLTPLSGSMPSTSACPPGYSTLQACLFKSSENTGDSRTPLPDVPLGTGPSTGSNATVEASDLRAAAFSLDTAALGSAHQPDPSVAPAPDVRGGALRFDALSDQEQPAPTHKYSLGCDPDAADSTAFTPPCLSSEIRASRSQPPGVLPSPAMSEVPAPAQAESESCVNSPAAGRQPLSAGTQPLNQAQGQATYHAPTKSSFIYGTGAGRHVVPLNSAMELRGSPARVQAGVPNPQLLPPILASGAFSGMVGESRFQPFASVPQTLPCLAAPLASTPPFSPLGASAILPFVDSGQAPSTFVARGDRGPVFPLIRPAGIGNGCLEVVGPPRRIPGTRDEHPPLWELTSVSGGAPPFGGAAMRSAAFRPVFPPGPHMSLSVRRNAAETLEPEPSGSPQSASGLCSAPLLMSRPCPDLSPNVCAPPASFGQSAPSSVPLASNSCRMSPPRVYHVVMCTRRYWRVEWVSPDTGRRVYKHFGENKYGGGEQAREVAMKFWDEVRRRSVDGVQRGEWAGLQEVTRRVREEGVDRILHEVASGGGGGDLDVSLQEPAPKQGGPQPSAAAREGLASHEPRQNEGECFAGHPSSDAQAETVCGTWDAPLCEGGNVRLRELSKPSRELRDDQSALKTSRNFQTGHLPPGFLGSPGVSQDDCVEIDTGQTPVKAQPSPKRLSMFPAYNSSQMRSSTGLVLQDAIQGCCGVSGSQQPSSTKQSDSTPEAVSGCNDRWGAVLPQKPAAPPETPSLLRDCQGGSRFFPASRPRHLQSSTEAVAAPDAQKRISGVVPADTIEPHSDVNILQTRLGTSQLHAANGNVVVSPTMQSESVQAAGERGRGTDGGSSCCSGPVDTGPRGCFPGDEPPGRVALHLLPKQEDTLSLQGYSGCSNARVSPTLKTEQGQSTIAAACERSEEQTRREQRSSCGAIHPEDVAGSVTLSERKAEWNATEAEDPERAPAPGTFWALGDDPTVLEKPPVLQLTDEPAGACVDGPQVVTSAATAAETLVPDKPKTVGAFTRDTAALHRALLGNTCECEKTNCDGGPNTQEAAVTGTFPLCARAVPAAESAGRSEGLAGRHEPKSVTAKGDSLWVPKRELRAAAGAEGNLWTAADSTPVELSERPGAYERNTFSWTPAGEVADSPPEASSENANPSGDGSTAPRGQTTVPACLLDLNRTRETGAFGGAKRMSEKPYGHVQSGAEGCQFAYVAHSEPREDSQERRQQEGMPDCVDAKSTNQTPPRSLGPAQLPRDGPSDGLREATGRLSPPKQDQRDDSLCKATSAKEEDETAAPISGLSSAAFHACMPGEPACGEEEDRAESFLSTVPAAFRRGEPVAAPGLARTAQEWAPPDAAHGPPLIPQANADVMLHAQRHSSGAAGRVLQLEAVLNCENEAPGRLHPIGQDGGGISLFWNDIRLGGGTPSVFSLRKAESDSSGTVHGTSTGEGDSRPQEGSTCGGRDAQPFGEPGCGASGRSSGFEVAEISAEGKKDGGRNVVGEGDSRSQDFRSRKQRASTQSSENYPSEHKASPPVSDICPSISGATPLVPSAEDRDFGASAPASPLSSFLSSTAANSRATSPGSSRHPQSTNSCVDQFHSKLLPPSLSEYSRDLPRTLHDPAFSQALLQLAMNSSIKGEQRSESLPVDSTPRAASPLSRPLEPLQAKCQQSAPEALNSPSTVSAQPSGPTTVSNSGSTVRLTNATRGFAPGCVGVASSPVVQSTEPAVSDSQGGGGHALCLRSQETVHSRRQFAGTVAPAAKPLGQSFVETDEMGSSTNLHLGSPNASIKNKVVKEPEQEAGNPPARIESSVCSDRRAGLPSINAAPAVVSHVGFSPQTPGELPLSRGGPSSLGGTEGGSESICSVPLKKVPNGPRLDSSPTALVTPSTASVPPLSVSRSATDNAAGLLGGQEAPSLSLSLETCGAFSRSSTWTHNFAGTPAASPRTSVLIHKRGAHAARRPAWRADEDNSSPKYVLRGEDTLLSSQHIGVHSQASSWPSSLSGVPSPRGLQLAQQQGQPQEIASGIASPNEAMPRPAPPVSLSHAAPELMYSSEGIHTQNASLDALGVPYRQYSLLYLGDRELEKGEHPPLASSTLCGAVKKGHVPLAPLSSVHFSASAGLRPNGAFSCGPKAPFASSSSGGARGSHGSGTSSTRHSTRTPGRIYSLLVRGVRCWRAEWHEKTSGQRRTRQYAAPKHGEERARAMCLWALCEANCVPVHLIKEAQERFGYDPRNRAGADPGGACRQMVLCGEARLPAIQGGDSDVQKKRKRGAPASPVTQAKASQESSVSVGSGLERYRRDGPGSQQRTRSWAEVYEREIREHPAREPETDGSLTSAIGNALGLELGTRHRAGALLGEAEKKYLPGHCQGKNEGSFPTRLPGEAATEIGQVHSFTAGPPEQLTVNGFRADRLPSPYGFAEGAFTRIPAPERGQSFDSALNIKNAAAEQREPETRHSLSPELEIPKPSPFSECSGLNEQPRRPSPVTDAKPEISDGQPTDRKHQVVKGTADNTGTDVAGLRDSSCGSGFYVGCSGTALLPQDLLEQSGSVSRVGKSSFHVESYVNDITGIGSVTYEADATPDMRSMLSSQTELLMFYRRVLGAVCANVPLPNLFKSGFL
ncbi:unnamed protein product [Neospora caninum Liverpool]|uniref:AP2 domain transcription factor AP2X-6 n=1 Tax=Neospora caninum (strain Liverpool) TaxID=572307 RepID=F0VKT9_NEOCL|nr:uncharacterized protein NCLIV_051170 [Neospora caninum Liverpool]CBZ54690.1 unnamed protein product [Neospora caninum Liverpool]|eukprot:XP_003884720.1 uncharacterized protein NCLIV_051170 [Neospora caninum Liverpool]